MKVLDAFGVPDPASLVRDVNALQAEGIGGYAYDDDVLAANPWTGAHVDALRAAGKAFLPIITLRTSSPAGPLTLLSALQALGCQSGPVGWDVEDTATPPYSVLQALVRAMRALGYGPMTGYFWPPLTWRPVYGDLFDFHWWGSGGAQPVIPAGWDAIQYGQEVANGTAYDVNVFDPVIFEGNMTLNDLDGLAVRVAGIQPTQPNEAAGAAWVRWMQATLGTAQANANTEGAVKAELDAIKASLGPGNPDVLAVVQRIEAAMVAAGQAESKA